jgi:dihydrofolate synthase/folylpolyglutamate synthase
VPVITVAGTTGKGSVCAYCASILTAAGHRVGTFTSPHLRDYRERIRIHDRLVRAEELVAAFERIERARAEIGLTFFEFNALAAFLIFEAARLDAWVLEIGMGGRLDAVNVLDPDSTTRNTWAPPSRRLRGKRRESSGPAGPRSSAAATCPPRLRTPRAPSAPR